MYGKSLQMSPMLLIGALRLLQCQILFQGPLRYGPYRYREEYLQDINFHLRSSSVFWTDEK